MKSLRLSFITSFPLKEFLSYEVRPPLVALPTLWDCSLLESETELLAELLLTEVDPFICLATLLPELLVEDDDSLTGMELLTEEEFLVEEDIPCEEVLLVEDVEFRTEEDDLCAEELLEVEEPSLTEVDPELLLLS
jgi:hypothetical protein